MPTDRQLGRYSLPNKNTGFGDYTVASSQNSLIHGDDLISYQQDPFYLIN